MLGTIKISNIDYLTFGDGNNAAAAPTKPYGNSLDVVSHEYSHGFLQAQIGGFSGVDAESGGLSEAYADFGSVVVDANYQQGGLPTDATWELGEVYINETTRGLRSWKDPRLRSATAKDWYPTRKNGPPDLTSHDNSHIMGHAYKLLVTGGFHVRSGQMEGTTQIPSLYVASIGQTKASKIFFEALKAQDMKGAPTFFDARDTTEAVALSLYGATTRDIVRRAWDAVGLGHGCSQPPAAPTVSLMEGCYGWFDVFLSAVAGATGYYVEASRYTNFAAPTSVLDQNATQCQVWISGTTYFRAKACNGCGCSGWSPTRSAHPHNGECP